MGALFGSIASPSRLCLGTAGFGSSIDKHDSFRVLDTFFEHGGNFIDTAHIYAAWLPQGAGASERTVGEWLRATGLRDRFVVATKGGHPPLEDMTRGRGGPDDLERDLDESLNRLGLDSVDMYWLHRDDRSRSVGALVETLARFLSDGRIKAYGGSNWTWERLADARDFAQRKGLPAMAASQPGWALADRREDTKPYPCMLYLDEATRRRHIETGFPLVAYSAQATGWFGAENTAWARGGFAGPAPRGGDAYDTPENRQRLLRAIALAHRHDCTPNQIALAYLLNQPFPVYPIIGTGRPEHVVEACEAVSLVLTSEAREFLRAG